MNFDPSREGVANFIQEGGLQLEPPTTTAAADFVRAAGDTDRYYSISLGTDRGQDEGSPRHWLLLAPHPQIRYGAYPIEFGITNADFTGKSHEEARFDHEFSLDETLRLNGDNIAVQELFPLIGGLVVEAVRKRGDLFVAGLEIRYKQVNDVEAIGWSQLIFSRALLGTQDRLREATAPLKKRPGWVNEFLKTRNRVLLAEKMALSGLAQARR